MPTRKGARLKEMRNISLIPLSLGADASKSLLLTRIAIPARDGRHSLNRNVTITCHAWPLRSESIRMLVAFAAFDRSQIDATENHRQGDRVDLGLGRSVRRGR